MARIEVTTHVEAPPVRVWEVLTDWEGQPRWMVDALDVIVLSDKREGVGVVVRCPTNIMGVVVVDDLEVTEWVEPRVLSVRHLGRVIRGLGSFELAETRYGTHLTWWEEIEVPGGEVGDALAGALLVPWVSRTFRASLARLKRVCESRAVGPAT